MGDLRSKWRRLREAWTVTRYGADAASRRTLAGCYARLQTGRLDETVVRARLRCGSEALPWAFRRNDIFTFGEILFEEQYRMRSELPPDPVVIDGGANIGLFSFLILSQRPRATIHAFEPEPGNFALLSENLARNDRIRLAQAAIGATEEPVRLHLARHGAEHSLMGPDDGGPSTEVPSIRLDRYLAEQGVRTVDLLKLDVEGSEAVAIEGLGDRLADVRLIVGEFHERLVTEADFYGRLERAGFETLSRTHLGDPDSGVHAFELRRRA